MQRRFTYHLLGLIGILTVALISACGTFEVGVEETATPAPEPTASSVPTSATPEPVPATATAEPTAIPTVTPSPSPQDLVRGIIFRTKEGLWRVGAGDEPTNLSNHADAQLSPDGSKIVYSDGEYLGIVDVQTGREELVTQAVNRGGCCATWWPAHPNTVIFSSWPAGVDRGMGSQSGIFVGFLSALDAESGEVQVLDGERDTVDSLAVSPDGQRIAYSGGRIAWLYPWGSSRPDVFDPAEFTVSAEGFQINSVIKPTWSPDSTKIAWYVQGQQEGVFSLALGVFDFRQKTVQIINPYSPIGTDGFPPAPVWSPDGEWIAYVAWDEDRQDAGLWVTRPDGSEQHPLATGSPHSLAGIPVWSPGGDWLFFSRSEGDGLQASHWMANTETWERQPVTAPISAKGRIVDWRPDQ